MSSPSNPPKSGRANCLTLLSRSAEKLSVAEKASPSTCDPEVHTTVLADVSTTMSSREKTNEYSNPSALTGANC